MSDNNQNIVDDIIQFLENEREIYGDFATKGLHQEETISSPVSPAVEVSNKGKTEPVKAEQTLEKQLQNCTCLGDLRVLCEQSSEVLKTDLDATNLVFGVGNEHADLMLVGEAPGEQEDIQCEPFVGKAGQLLNKILAAINFRREDIYIANILKHRPPNNRNPEPDERTRSLPFLLRQIEIIQPKLILCLGKVSATTLLNRNDSLRNLRGKFHPFHGTELMVTYHPAALLRNPQWKRPVWEDVQKLRKRYDELGCKP